MVPSPDDNLKLKLINRELEDFTRLSNNFADLMIFDETNEEKEKLPFFFNTPENRAKRAEIQEKAKNHVGKKIKKSGLGIAIYLTHLLMTEKFICHLQ